MRQVMRLVAVLGCLVAGAIDVAAQSSAGVAAGGYHTCALTAGGGVVCWGDNGKGQLGDGTKTFRLTPISVSGLSSGVMAVVAAQEHACTLTASGGVLCWGTNWPGRLGDGTTTDRLTPAPVVGLSSEATAITAGVYHTCALTTGGGVECWGGNFEGAIGDGTTTHRVTPTPVVDLSSGVTAIVAGGEHTCALTTAGGVVCWGSNIAGQLGDGTTTDRLTPTPVVGLSSGVTAIAAGLGHTCALTTGGGMVCWGYNSPGQLGDGTTTDRSTPTPVVGLSSGVAAITAGGYHTCALTTGGDVECWGANGVDATGYGTTPVLVVGLSSGVTAITAGGSHTCALTIRGSVECWGWNGSGQLGDGTIAPRLTPRPVSGLTGVGAFSDLSGDRKSDLVWRHATGGDVWLWPMDGPARTAESYVRTISDTNWEIRAIADFDGDGKADLFWRNKTNGQLYFWPMDGANPQGETYVGTIDPAYDIVGSGDFDGDGKADLLWRHMTLGDVWVWLMDGATPLDRVYVDRVDPAYVVKGVGDLDANGRTDIVWHGVAGDVWVWLMDGTTRLDQVWVGTVPDTGYKIEGVADVTGDGKADLVWWHATRGEVWLWTMNGPVREAETWVGTVPDTTYRIAGTGDYDGDGKADLLWRNVVNGEVWVWLMNGPVRVSETWVATVRDVGYRVIR